MISGARDIQDRERFGGLPRGQEQRGHAALERRDALLNGISRRVHYSRVDVARFGQAEQRRGVVGVVEGVRGGLVDRQRPRVGRGVRGLPGVDLLGLERPVDGWVDSTHEALQVRGPSIGPALAVQL